MAMAMAAASRLFSESAAYRSLANARCPTRTPHSNFPCGLNLRSHPSFSSTGYFPRLFCCSSNQEFSFRNVGYFESILNRSSNKCKDTFLEIQTNIDWQNLTEKEFQVVISNMREDIPEFSLAMLNDDERILFQLKRNAIVQKFAEGISSIIGDDDLTASLQKMRSLLADNGLLELVADIFKYKLDVDHPDSLIVESPKVEKRLSIKIKTNINWQNLTVEEFDIQFSNLREKIPNLHAGMLRDEESEHFHLKRGLSMTKHLEDLSSMIGDADLIGELEEMRGFQRGESLLKLLGKRIARTIERNIGHIKVSCTKILKGRD